MTDNNETHTETKRTITVYAVVKLTVEVDPKYNGLVTSDNEVIEAVRSNASYDITLDAPGMEETCPI